MAFIFVPNPDGSFTEGDRQTNPDTGVEYCYIDGAWRALGPKIEDEFDTLDDRYIKLEGTTITGDSYRLRGPNATGDAVATYHSISNGSQKLYHIETPEDENINWVANVEYVQQKIDEIPDVDLSRYVTKDGTQTIGTDHWKVIQQNQSNANRTFIDIYDGSMHLYNVADPTDGADGWAVNKAYVDNLISSGAFLSLTGGSLTGLVDITRDDPDKAALRTIGSINVKADGELINGSNNFTAHKDYVRVYSTPVAGADVANKSYTDGTFKKKIDRPGLKFGFQSGSDVPASGKFTWYNSGGQKMKINATTKDGIPWAVDTPIVDINFSEGHMFSIWATVSGTSNWRLKRTGTINRIDYHANDILCYVSYSADNGSFSTSAEYNITISGLI